MNIDTGKKLIKEKKYLEAEKIFLNLLKKDENPLLINFFLGGIYFELQTPGVGFPIIAAIIAGILYLTPYYLNGLAENWEILMFLVGIILIGIEIFIIPGFGIFGILGILFTISSLVLIMVNNDFLDFTFVFPAELFNATGSVLIAVLGFIVLLFFGGIKLSESQYFKKMHSIVMLILPNNFVARSIILKVVDLDLIVKIIYSNLILPYFMLTDHRYNLATF